MYRLYSLVYYAVWRLSHVILLPFCKTLCLDLKAAATWEVDGSGSSTGTPFSMYLLSGTILSLVINYSVLGVDLPFFEAYWILLIRKVDFNKMLIIFFPSSAGVIPLEGDKEISISYGAKGNEVSNVWKVSLTFSPLTCWPFCLLKWWWYKVLFKWIKELQA